jgi:hypothetical protein
MGFFLEKRKSRSGRSPLTGSKLEWKGIPPSYTHLTKLLCEMQWSVTKPHNSLHSHRNFSAKPERRGKNLLYNK